MNTRANGAYITTPLAPWEDVPEIPGDRLTINVHPPRETKRHVGYAPWPSKHKKKKRKKK